LPWSAEWVGTNPQYVSEIDADVIKGLSGRSAFFSEMEHVLFTASNECRDAGFPPPTITVLRNR
jgi:hypothetical protein